jgi:hypothetical protein
MSRTNNNGIVVESCIAIACIAAFLMWMRVTGPGAAEHFAQPQYTGIDYERLYAVATAFRRVLERPPTEAELQKYEGQLSMDPEFDVPSLETHLRQSAEYKRLVGVQKNSTLAEVGGVVSEQAIRGKISDMYFRITGQKADGVTMELLYSRYRHTNLSDSYLTALIQQMADVPGASGASGASGSSATSGTVKSAKSANVSKSVASESKASGGGGGSVATGVDGNGGYASAGSSGSNANDGSITIERQWLRSLGLSDNDLKASPSSVISRLQALSQSCRSNDVAEDRYKKAEVCKRDRQRMLDSIGYDEGEQTGSWTMPRNRDRAKLKASISNLRALQASNEQTSLIGTLLSDVQGQNMTLFP